MNEFLLILLFAAPLALAALGDCVAQRSGVLNIGIEGQMLASAFVGISIASATQNALIGLGGAIAVGAALAIAASVLMTWMRADQVVVGTAMTLLCLGMTGSAYRAEYSRSTAPISAPSLVKFAGIDVVIVAMLIIAGGLMFVFSKTRWGLRITATGEYPEAVEATGVSPIRLRFLAMAIAGSLAGLAGGYLSIGVAGSFSENMTQGRGFVAIAMVTFGRWKPHWIFCACIFMGWLESLQFTAQAQGWNVPFQWLLAAPYVVALVVMVMAGRGAMPPAALGKAFRSAK